MALDAEVLEEIAIRVRGGFDERDRIVEILCEEMYEPGTLATDEVEAEVTRAFDRKKQEQRSWPAKTDCDKLDDVFAALNAAGLVALQNAGYTQSDGYDDVRDAVRHRGGPNKVVGYCFYHGQDLDRAVRGLGLWLAFGPMNAATEETEGPKVGAAIVAELQRRGFEVQWDGTFSQRILVPKIDWKRR